MPKLLFCLGTLVAVLGIPGTPVDVQQELQEKGATIKRYCLYGILLHDKKLAFAHTNDFGVSIGREWKGGKDGLLLLERQPHLKELNLHEPSEEMLAMLGHVSPLEGLYLFGTNVRDENLECLESMKQSLKAVSLVNTSITNSSVERLGRLTKLRFLGLAMAKISDNALVHLKKLENLEVLNLEGTDTTIKALESLKDLKMLRTIRISDGAVLKR